MISSDPTTCRLLDEIAANATVAPVTRLVDGWLAKAATGLPFRRANAVLPPVGAGADPRGTARALDALDAWYRSQGQRLLVQVPSTDAALDDLLDARGLTVEAPVDVLVAEAEALADAGSRAVDRLRVAGDGAGSRPVDLRVEIGVDEGWARSFGVRHGDDERWRGRTEAYGRMLSVLGDDVLTATAVAGPHTVAVGFAVLERGWAGVFGMATAAGRRRSGLGAALLGALAIDVRNRSAHHLYLQVETDNPAAQGLYAALGFRRSHGYHYRVSAPP